MNSQQAMVGIAMNTKYQNIIPFGEIRDGGV